MADGDAFVVINSATKPWLIIIGDNGDRHWLPLSPSCIIAIIATLNCDDGADSNNPLAIHYD
jgi:hypothetical protein